MSAPDQKDLENGRALLAKAVAGDALGVARLLDEGASGWWYKIELVLDTPPRAILDKREVSRFVMLSLHNDMKKQNIPLYMAAWHGHEGVVDVFLQRHAYDSDTLMTALYGAVSAGSLPIVKGLLAAGADPLAARGIILRDNIEAAPEITAALIAAADKGEALAIVIAKEKKDLALSLLGQDREIDLHPALDAICAALNVHENVYNPQDGAYYLEMLHILTGYEEGRGGNVPALAGYTMKQALKNWAVPVIDAVVQDPGFDDAVPQRQALLNLALQVVTGLAGKNRMVAEGNYAPVVEHLLEKGADPRALLFDAVEMSHVKFAHLALKHGADPRMQAVLKAEGMIWEGDSFSSLTVRDVLSLGVISLSHDEADFLAGGKGARYATGLTPEFLRFASIKTRHSGLALALMCGEGKPALEALLAAPQPLCADDLLMADRDGYRVVDHVLRDAGLTEKILDVRNWHFRASEYERVWNMLPEKVREQFSSRHEETQSVLQSMQDQRDLRMKAAAHKNRFRLK